MAKYVLTDPFVNIDGVDYSAAFKSGEFNLSRAELDAAAGGDDTEIKKLGLRQISLRLTMFQDYTDNALDEALFNIWNGEDTVPIRIRPSKTDAISAANPEYQFDAVLPSYQPIKGQHGQMVMTDPVFAAAGSITRDVTP